MQTEINQGVLKGLTYKAGTKESDPASIGRIVIEFDADGSDAAPIAALIGQRITVTLETPQLSMVNPATGELMGAR